MTPSRRRNAIPAFAGLAAFAAAGCGGDDGTGPGANLSPEEAGAVARAVSQQIFAGSVALSDDGTASLAPAVRRLDPDRASSHPTTTTDFALSTECDRGGTAGWSGQATRGGHPPTVTLDATVTMSDCASATEEGTVTVTTTPNFEVAVEARRPSEGEFRWTGSLAGSFDWTLDGETGSCQLEVTSDLSGTDVGDGTGSLGGSTSGSVCGHEVSRSFSVDFGGG